jgi:glycosyltransferase involved in cell wall biosynthesis
VSNSAAMNASPFSTAARESADIFSAAWSARSCFEILVSDNASSDDTNEVLLSFNDERLRAIRQPINIGLLPNWNACVEAARGDYIVVLCDDDTVEPWLLERGMAVVEKNPQVPVVIAPCDLHDSSTGRAVRARTSQRLRTGLCDGTEPKRRLSGEPHPHHYGMR